MSEQPPVQPPNRPTQGNPPTQPMPASGAPPAGPSAPPAGPPAPPAGPPVPPVGPPAGPAAGSASPDAPKPSMWRRATATTGRSIALAVAAGALVVLLFLVLAIAGVALLRHNDRVDLLGQRQDRQSLRDDGPGNGNGNGKGKGFGDSRGPGADKEKERRVLPGLPGGRGQGQGGLGNLMGGAALHGTVTATADGSVQALLFQRGEVTAVSATSITLKSTDGFVGTYGRNADTKANGVAPVKGGQAFVLARASDKVALRTIATPAGVGVVPSS